MRRFAVVTLLLALTAPAVFAQIPITSITPDSGPTTGGTVVTLKGDFSSWPYYVHFGAVPAVSSERVDNNTIVAVTPPHLPGVAPIRVFDYDMVVDTTATFTFTGGVPEALFERILVPLLTPPVFGAFGSEFHTDLRLTSKNPQQSLQVFGLRQPCNDTPPGPVPSCTWDPANDAMYLNPGSDLGPGGIDYFGQPGRFIYLTKTDAAWLAGNLRVHDVSRAALNYGTEIPLVRRREFQNETVLLPGVPGDPRFRNTLRIYGDANMPVTVTVQGQPPVEVQLTGADEAGFAPSYGSFTIPTMGAGPYWVRIDGPPPLAGPSPPIFIGSFWAFVSVTNNETQVISTITPQP